MKEAQIINDLNTRQRRTYLTNVSSFSESAVLKLYVFTLVIIGSGSTLKTVDVEGVTAWPSKDTTIPSDAAALRRRDGQRLVIVQVIRFGRTLAEPSMVLLKE